jgi:hypothetical protein
MAATQWLTSGRTTKQQRRVGKYLKLVYGFDASVAAVARGRASWGLRDRTGWEPGPWDDEPDKIEFTTTVGLPGLIVRSHSGGLCGYVGVPPGHQFYGVDYSQCVRLAAGRECDDAGVNPFDAVREQTGYLGQAVRGLEALQAMQDKHMNGRRQWDWCDHTPENYMWPHGGITYSYGSSGDICRDPLPGQADGVWWLGFDCDHGGDFSPALQATVRRVGCYERPPYNHRAAIKEALSTPGWSGVDIYKTVPYVRAEVEQLARQLNGF